jgi:hypothetical protein
MCKKYTYTLLILLFISDLRSQDTILNLNKIDSNEFVLDGIISKTETEGAKILEVKYEEEPGYNVEPSQRTIAYLTYSNKYLYVGIKAFRDKVIAPVTTRDNRALWRGDFTGLAIDTFGDARNNIIISSNPSGSQADAIRMPGTGRGGGPSVNSNVNYDFKSMGSITSDGYYLEFLIPFSELPFPNGKNQAWKIKIFTGYLDDENAGAEVRAGTSMSSRDSSCQLCLLDHTIILKDIEIDKKLNFLPYVSSNLSGTREKFYDRINFETPELSYGLGFDIELNKNLSIEGTINPDFSQVEADVTKLILILQQQLIIQNRRPFFNRGIDAIDYYLRCYFILGQ